MRVAYIHVIEKIPDAHVDAKYRLLVLCVTVVIVKVIISRVP